MRAFPALSIMRHTLTLVALAALASCTEPHPAVPFPPDAVEVSPAAPYARWWAMTESCSGRSGNLAAIHFYVVPGATLEGDGQSYRAYWYSEGNRIVFANGRSTNGGVVRHEMLHALLGRGDHPREDFVDRCGGIVDFGDGLHEEAPELLPPPVTGSPVLNPSDFQITLTVTPDPVRLGQPDSGWVTAIVSVTNSRPEPVWVRIPRSDYDYAGSTLGAETHVTTDGWTTQAIESRYSIDTLIPFGAREVKRHAVDVKLDSGSLGLRVRGLFSTSSTLWREIVIAP